MILENNDFLLPKTKAKIELNETSLYTDAWRKTKFNYRKRMSR